jgi:putative sigma-54 modulation protein
MQLGIQARGFTLTDGLRNYCDRRLRFALGSTINKVRSVIIRLADENGPRGGIDKRCTIRAIMQDAPLVVVVQDEADLYVAIDRAADRAARAISRQAEKSWTVRRPRARVQRHEGEEETRSY